MVYFLLRNALIFLIYFIFSYQSKNIQHSLNKPDFFENCSRKEYLLKDSPQISINYYSQVLSTRQKFIDLKQFDLKFDIASHKLIENNENVVNYSSCFFMINETLTKINAILRKNKKTQIILQEKNNQTSVLKIFDVYVPEIEIKLFEIEEFSLNNSNFLNFSFLIETNETQNFNKLEIMIKSVNNNEKIINIPLGKDKKTYFVCNVQRKTDEISEIKFIFDDFFILKKNKFFFINNQTKKKDRSLQAKQYYHTVSPIDLNFTINANCAITVNNLFFFYF